MSFDFDVTQDVFDGEGSYQGDLASSYTNELKAYLLSDEGADFAAYLSHAINLLEIEDALAVKDLILNGSFQLSGLFSAAQSKTGYVDGDAITDPTPTLTVTMGDGSTVVIDLTNMLDGTDTATWNEITTFKKTVYTTYHTREFYTDSMTPDGYEADWAAPQNAAPTADKIVLDVNEYDDVADDGDKIVTIDLLADANADDADDDAMSVIFDDSQLPAYVTYADGKLTIDTDSTLLDHLPKGEKEVLTFTYQITDGTDTISNTVTLTIIGTNDVATISGDATGTVTEDGTIEITGLTLTVTDPDDGESSFKEVTNLDGTYGSFDFDESTGDWGYTLDNDSELVQALKYYQTPSDTLTVTSLDGTATEHIEVTIQGAADQYHYTLTTAATQTVSDTGDGHDPNYVALDGGNPDDGSISLVLSGVDTLAYNFSGSVDVSVTGDINKTNGSTYDQEWVLVTADGGDSVNLGPVAYTGTLSGQQEGSSYFTTDQTASGELVFASPDNTVVVTYDATNEVRDFTVTATITDFYYWV